MKYEALHQLHSDLLVYSRIEISMLREEVLCSTVRKTAKGSSS